MQSGHLEKPSDPQLVPAYRGPRPDNCDEINLMDLWGVLVRRKGVVLLSFITCMILAVFYIYTTEPLYRIKVHLLPPQQQEIQGLMTDYSGEESTAVELYAQEYTPEYVYSEFLKNAKSQGLRREFFDKQNLVAHFRRGKLDADLSVDQIFDAEFDKNLRVEIDKQNPSFVAITLASPDPELAAQWLDQFVLFINKRTVQQMYDDVNSGIQAELGQVRYQLNSKLNLAEQRRLDTIDILREALSVAKVLGISGSAGVFPTIGTRMEAGIAVNTAQVPLYARGIKALETEISVLESRKSDEPFISGYRDLQERSAYLEGIFIDTEMLSAIKVDVSAKIPYQAEKPNTVLVILAAGVFGVLVGVFLGIFVEWLSKTRRDPS